MAVEPHLNDVLFVEYYGKIPKQCLAIANTKSLDSSLVLTNIVQSRLNFKPMPKQVSAFSVDNYGTLSRATFASCGWG
jgi:hypothetical protein